jgi:hypothetical protein
MGFALSWLPVYAVLRSSEDPVDMPASGRGPQDQPGLALSPSSFLVVAREM